MKSLFINLATDLSAGNLPQGKATVSDVLGIVFAIIGALAFLMVVVSGLRFVLSAGEPERAAKARSALIYALAGLLIAVSAEAIVSFVVKDL